MDYPFFLSIQLDAIFTQIESYDWKIVWLKTEKETQMMQTQMMQTQMIFF